MFFNSINKQLRKMYQNINPQLKDKVFPNGENEFVFVGTMLNQIFQKKFSLQELIQLYASTHTYHILEKGNSYKTYNYLKNKNNNLNNDDIFSLIALVTLIYSNNNYKNNSREKLFEHKSYAQNYVDIVNGIEKNKHIFATKNNDEIGTSSNPIMVSGITGIQKYLDDSGCNAIIKNSIVALSLTDTSTNITYCIDCTSNNIYKAACEK